MNSATSPGVLKPHFKHSSMGEEVNLLMVIFEVINGIHNNYR